MITTTKWIDCVRACVCVCMRETFDICIHRTLLLANLLRHRYNQSFFWTFCKNYCRKTTEATIMKIVPNESKFIYTINILIVASWCMLLLYPLVVI